MDIRRLSRNDNRADFDCGTAELNRYLQQTARQDSERDLSATYILVASAESKDILGYYTLTVGSIEPSLLLGQKLPPSRQTPVVLLGRLAVDTRHQRRRLGERLLFSALSRAQTVAVETGGFAVVVDAKDEKAARFYNRYGFQHLTG